MKFKAKKLIPVVLSVLMVGSLFAGCTKTPENEPDKKPDGDKPSASTVEVTGVTLDKNTIELDIAGTQTLVATVAPENATTKTVTWTSDNTAVATVADGVVTAVAAGKATITAKAGEKTATCTVTVKSAQVEAFNDKIYVVGDSTVCAFSDPYYMPRYGYGTQLGEYLNVTGDQIVNLALSGRSSLSFTYDLDNENGKQNYIEAITGKETSCYKYLTNNITAGDYLIIGFGHNDEKSDDATRYTSPVGDKDTAGSFQNSLYTNYVKMAADKGATPILCTPVVRHSSKGEYTGANGHVTADGDYAEAIRQLGQATSTTVIDLTDITKTIYETDNEAATKFHAYTSYTEAEGVKTPAGMDGTHLNKYGAKRVAYEFANALKATDCALKNVVKADIAAPTEAADYESAINTGYTKPDYVPFEPSSYEANELGGGWYKTVMGDIGGADKIPTYVVEKSADKFTIGCEKANGKISGSTDGFAAAFMQISKDDNFTATVKATVKSCTAANNQSAFGMMLRDDIIIDEAYKAGFANYVAGGLYNTKANVFGRFNEAQSKNASCSTAVAVDMSYDITIERVGQIITVTVTGCDPVVFQESAMDLFARDNNYMYLCLFANRGIVAEFTNFTYTKTGTSQGA